ncbi:molybdopterin-dependent oxidoreductase [Sulfurovum sp.]|uniref:molybdopterin oxidoreductase family protein n=1 Tax=Sulfurovum sp. TaxID=1969726 RepID=UPI002867E5E5|nr:molybdopterin-dependent oxidoreductase [Sulfurovum sp.]
MSETVCAYCGVGCKFEIQTHKLMGVKSYPANQGMSCAKGISQSQTIHTNRLLKVQCRKTIKDVFRPSNYEDSFKMISDKIRQTANPDRIGFYLSGQMLNEDYYVANKLAKGFVGTANCDTNSRTCMASAVVGYKKSFGLDYVPVRMNDIEHCNLMILIGANVAEAHVVLSNRIKKAQKNGLKVVVIDPRFTLSAKSADLYLPLKAGADIDLLNLLAIKLIKSGNIDHDFIISHSHDFESYREKLLLLDEEKLLESSGIDSKLFDTFYQLFIESKNIITAWTMGLNQSIQGVDKNLAVNNLHIITGQINKKGSGPFSLTGQPNAMGGREVGGLSTSLAVHLDYNEKNCKKVSDFWKSKKLPQANGLTAFEMIQKAEQNELDILIICHTDPVYHLPHRNFVEAAFKKIPLVVEINAYNGSETSKFAHIQIPTVPFGQKEGTQTNLDRTLTRVVAFEEKNGLLQDWEVFAKIGHYLGHKKSFDFKSSKEVFEEYQEMTKLSDNKHLDIYKADYDALEHTPFVWGEELYQQNCFFTADQKANLFFIENQNLSEQPSEEYPFILLTGRTRDQWHTGSKTAQAKNLLKYKELEFVEMNPSDAQALRINEGDIIKVISLRGNLKAKVVFADMNVKTIFIPISHREINYLTNDKLDPLSKEPDYNHSTVRIEKIDDSKFL